MGKNTTGVSRGPRTSVKAPLIFSAVLAVVAGVAVFVFSTGGATKEPRIDLGLIAAGIAFVVSLVVCAMLMMVDKPNDEDLGAGSGINRRSADREPGHGADTDSSGGPKYGVRLDDPDAVAHSHDDADAGTRLHDDDAVAHSHDGTDSEGGLRHRPDAEAS